MSSSQQRVVPSDGSPRIIIGVLGDGNLSRSSPREARLPPKAAGAGGAPELREGRQAKLGCDSTAATQLPRLNSLSRRESVLCTYGIFSIMKHVVTGRRVLRTPSLYKRDFPK